MAGFRRIIGSVVGLGEVAIGGGDVCRGATCGRGKRRPYDRRLRHYGVKADDGYTSKFRVTRIRPMKRPSGEKWKSR